MAAAGLPAAARPEGSLAALLPAASDALLPPLESLVNVKVAALPKNEYVSDSIPHFKNNHIVPCETN